MQRAFCFAPAGGVYDRVPGAMIVIPQGYEAESGNPAWVLDCGRPFPGGRFAQKGGKRGCFAPLLTPEPGKNTDFSGGSG